MRERVEADRRRHNGTTGKKEGTEMDRGKEKEWREWAEMKIRS